MQICEVRLNQGPQKNGLRASFAASRQCLGEQNLRLLEILQMDVQISQVVLQPCQQKRIQFIAGLTAPQRVRENLQCCRILAATAQVVPDTLQELRHDCG